MPSGAGSKSDQVAARILKKGGLDLLANYAKLHFANTQKAQKFTQRKKSQYRLAALGLLLVKIIFNFDKQDF